MEQALEIGEFWAAGFDEFVVVATPQAEPVRRSGSWIFFFLLVLFLLGVLLYCYYSGISSFKQSKVKAKTE